MRRVYSSDDDTIPPEYAPQKMMEHIKEGLAALGIEFDSAQKHVERLTNTGFTNVSNWERRVPVGTWAKGRDWKIMGTVCRTAISNGLDALMLGPLTRGLGWSKEQVEEFSVPVRKHLFDPSIHAYVCFQAVWAQKPLDDAAKENNSS